MIAENEQGAQLERLIAINTEDILGAVGLKGVERGRQLLKVLCRRPARAFAQQVLDYDAQVGGAGLSAGAQAALPLFRVTLTVEGEAQLPTSGPLLILANHPGLTDTLALFASIHALLMLLVCCLNLPIYPAVGPPAVDHLEER